MGFNQARTIQKEFSYKGGKVRTPVFSFGTMSSPAIFELLMSSCTPYRSRRTHDTKQKLLDSEFSDFI